MRFVTFRSCLGLLFGLLAAFFPHAARATAPGQVVAWGSNNAGQISVPVSATDGVIAIAAGDSFSAALKDNGTVVTWGDSYNPAEIAVPSGVNNITAIAAGVEHIVALRSDGKVAAWGYNIGGEVTGMPGGGITSANPVTLGGQVLSNVVGVACGTVHSIAVKNDGTVVVWGSNYFGQLNVPAGLTDVVAAAGGMYHSLALKSDGTVVAWGGQNTYGEINVPAGLTDVVQVSAGEYYSMALKSDGTVVAWGDNSQGQLNVPAGLNDAVQIAAARHHALALKSDATIVAWGSNSDGQTTISTSAQSCVLAVGGGLRHSLAVVTVPPTVLIPPADQTRLTSQTAAFTVSASGTPPYSYQWYKDGVLLANGVRISGVTTATLTVSSLTVADAGDYTVELGNCTDMTLSAPGHLTVTPVIPPGVVIAWGDDTFGQSNVPQAAKSGVIAIAAGQGHTLALKTNGSVLAWGWNTSGQTTVPADAGSGVIGISAGQGHSLALKSDGTVLAWGNGADGQTNLPVGLSGVVAIAGGGAQSLALKNDGTVVVWGNNSSSLPSGLTGVTAIAAGMYHALALKSDGTVATWGDDSHGQSTVPAGLTDVIAIAAGFYHSIAVKADGTVIAWGDDSYGQSSVPSGLSDIVAAAGGRYHTVVRKNDKTLVAWGDDSVGQSTIPTTVQGRTLALAAGWMHTVVIAGRPAIILGGPYSAYTNLNHDVIFHVDVDGTGPISLQWRRQSVAGSSDISGATDSTLTLRSVQASDSGSYAVVVSNAFGTATGYANLTVLPATTFTLWQQNRFTETELADPGVAGPLADPTGKGTPNLIKYALNLEPVASAGGPSIPSSPWPLQPTFSGGTLMMTFRALRTDVSYMVEASTDLKTWSGTGVTTKYNGIDCTATCTPTASNQVFLRLRVSMPGG
ncbi:MAG: immunoglobulin domain-containing protein [Prosthecobacter sp.]|uniref:immunoglobulin domain-containing protein n=1 Tax=Prosthecobacter sp. TaxID=1965333 RepID=UPI003BAF7F2E